MPEKLFVLRDSSKLGRAILKPPHHFYLRKISKSGRTAYFTADINKALQMPRSGWDRWRIKFPTQTKGRLVRAPIAIATPLPL